MNDAITFTKGTRVCHKDHGNGTLLDTIYALHPEKYDHIKAYVSFDRYNSGKEAHAKWMSVKDLYPVAKWGDLEI